MTFIDYFKIIVSIILILGALPTFAFFIRLCDSKHFNTMESVLLASLGTFLIVIGMLIVAAIFGSPYIGDDCSSKHSPKCATRINGLWLPGKHCTCGARKY